MTRRFVPLLLAVTLLAALTPYAAAVGACGGVTLDVVNPDLQPKSDGFVHASGALLVQVRPAGVGADAVASVELALGRHVPSDARSCDTPTPLTGAYGLESRVDDSPRDGFFVPLNTTRLLDGDYALLVRALDASGEELGRRLLDARVENGRATPVDAASVDRAGPWPRVLPGDGEQTHADGGLTIEFAEPVAQVTVHVNEAPRAIVPWNASATSASALPLAADVPVTAYRAADGVRAGDVVRVAATDASGNRVEKTVRVGGAPVATGEGADASAGTLSLAIANAGDVTAAPNGTVDVPVNVTNPSASAVQVVLTAQSPSNLNVTFTPRNVTVPANATAHATARVRVASDAQAGAYTVLFTAAWTDGDEAHSRAADVVVHVTMTRSADPVRSPGGGASAGNATSGNGSVVNATLDAADADATTAGADDASAWAVPAPAPVLVLAAVASVGVLVRRVRPS